MLGLRNRGGSQYEDRYRIINGERDDLWWRCVYCGRPAGTRDHVPPLSRVDDYDAMHLKYPVYIKVPACDRCNNLGGSEVEASFMDRAEAIKNKLARRYTRYMSMPEWTEKEINELGRNLRSKVRSANDTRKRYAAEVEYYEGVDLVTAQVLELLEIDLADEDAA